MNEKGDSLEKAAVRAANADSMLDLVSELGKQLLKNGAEISRVEQSIVLIFKAYGYEQYEVFALPSCIILNLEEQGHNYSKTVRIRSYTINMDRLNNLNHLSRIICDERPPFKDAFDRLDAVIRRPVYPAYAGFLAYGFGALFFTLFYGGGAFDFLLAFFCGLCVRKAVVELRRVGTNTFFTILAAACVASIPPLILQYIGAPIDIDKVIIGTIILLVPGVAITNVMRDILAGDFLTAVSRLTEVLLISVAIAIGVAITIAGMRVLFGMYTVQEVAEVDVKTTYITCLYAVFASAAFCIIFEIRKLRNIITASLLGASGWLIYLLLAPLGSEIGRYFLAAAAVAAFSELFARVYKTPVTLFLIVAILPLVPGGTLYYAMKYMLDGNNSMFATYGMYAVEYAAAIAIGGAFVSAIVRSLVSQSIGRRQKQ